MKLKYNFVTRNIDGNPIAVAVGKDNAEFNGIIKLNATGGFIFEMLSSETTVEDIIAGLVREYDVSETEAVQAVRDFIEKLRKNGLLAE